MKKKKEKEEDGGRRTKKKEEEEELQILTILRNCHTVISHCRFTLCMFFLIFLLTSMCTT